MKLSKNAITVIISTVVLLVCVIVNYAESRSEKEHTIIITPNQSATSQGDYSEALNEETEFVTAVSEAIKKSKASKSSATTALTSSKTSSTKVTFSFPADINQASFAMLCSIDGIGEATANSILSYRESIGGFKSMYDLLDISGIGEKKLVVLMRYFYVVNDIGRKTSSQTTVFKTTQTSEATTASMNTYTTTASVTSSNPRVRKLVNINTADAKELEESLLISQEMSEEIVEVRRLIGGYTNIRELLMVDNFTAALLVEVDEYLIL